MTSLLAIIGSVNDLLNLNNTIVGCRLDSPHTDKVVIFLIHSTNAPCRKQGVRIQ